MPTAVARSILGLMVTRGSRFVIRSWLDRHVAMFEYLAVLDGSTNSMDADTTRRHCERYRNVLYANERDANLTSAPTDQTTRAAATRLLLRALGSDDTTVLEGRWIFLAHPDEYYVQDVRELATLVGNRDPHATVVLFDILYALPTPEEREAILAHNSSTAVEAFEPIAFMRHCDAAYAFREPRLFKWTRGTRWGKRHSLSTPERHPGHRQWPTAREAAMRHTPFYVHFKAHDFSPDAFALMPSQQSGGGSWIAFRNSGFATGIAPHRTHGDLSYDKHALGGAAALDLVFAYYERAGRRPSPLKGEIRKRCAAAAVRCSVGWRVGERF